MKNYSINTITILTNYIFKFKIWWGKRKKHEVKIIVRSSPHIGLNRNHFKIILTLWIAKTISGLKPGIFLKITINQY